MNNNELIEAARAVLDRWDSTDWKAAPTAERKCVCDLKNICLSPICIQEFEPCSSYLNWCCNIGIDGSQCAHDKECHQQREET